MMDRRFESSNGLQDRVTLSEFSYSHSICSESMSSALLKKNFRTITNLFPRLERVGKYTKSTHSYLK